MSSLNTDFYHGRKRQRDDAPAVQHDADSIKRMRQQDVDYTQDLNTAYMPDAYDPMSSTSFAPYPNVTSAQPQPAYWGMPTQRPPQQHPHPVSMSQPQPQPPPPAQHQYYTMPADPVSNLPYPAPTEWWQPRPSVSYNNVLENWNYQIDEPCVYGADASQHLKLQSLATLDNLSTQIILNLAKGSLNDILLLTAGRDHEGSQAYFTRRTLFDQTRKVYAKNAVFIDMYSLPSFTASQQEIVRKANRAIFISSILEGHDISFFDLDSRFLDTFICPGQRLLKWQGIIFLELKTQAYIAALMNNDGPSDALLDELFPPDLADQLLARHPDAPNLAPSEQDFLDRARARKQYLFNEPAYDAFTTLPRKYGWHDFLREFAVCLNKNVEAVISNPARTPTSQPGQISPSFRNDSHASPPPAAFPNTSSPMPAGSDVGNAFGGQSSLGQDSARRQATPLQPIRRSPDIGQVVPSPKVRSKPPKQGGSATQRQPWKQEEEDALMAGLAEVKGPHWSQILSLYGRGGSVSEVLKDRNQIQLKDKARNLKLYYLKMGKEVPECLRGVTGELRKRGGARVRAALGLTDDDDSRSKKGSKSGTPLDPSLD